MAEFNSPSEIAREVLRRLTTRRIQPTPENFRALYLEISGGSGEDVFPERSFKQIAQAFPRATPEQLRQARLFETAITDQNWASLKQYLIDLVSSQTQESLNWSSVIRDLLVQMERRQSGLNSVAKQEALNRVLDGTSDPTLLHGRMQGLIRGWAQMPTATGMSVDLVEETTTAAVVDPATAIKTSEKSDLKSAPEEWRGLLANLLETVAGLLLVDMPDLVAEASALAKSMRDPALSMGEEFEPRLKQFAYKIQWAAQDQSHIRQTLLNLLQLIIENIGELTVDDKWFQGQVSGLMEIFSKPLDKGTLSEFSERLRDVIHKQGSIKRNLSEAQDRLRQMLAVFVDRLGEFAESTGNYHGKITVFAQRISAASSLQELTGLVDEISKETELVEHSAKKSQQELHALRETVDQANQEIARLESQLEQASELVRHDPLTGALNRKGFEEILGREVSRQSRRNSQLCISMLDVDDFKKLNDTHGHATGDDALKHLSMVIRDNLRPQDSCARFGGEEFLVLLPDTGLEDAAQAMRRLQRELTKRFFMHENQKLLITFSAGVAEVHVGEEPELAIKRADKAMYRAKKSGKNRVETG